MKTCLVPEGEPIFSEMATTVEIVDEAGGEFLEVRQQCGKMTKADLMISINPEEWPMLRAAIDVMVAKCRPTK